MFRDEALQAGLDRNGYAVVPLLDAAALADLAALERRVHAALPQEFFPSTFSLDPEYRRTVDAGIRAVVAPAAARVFDGARLRYGSFIVKSPGPRGIVDVHQDMTLVDESRSNGLNFWCPLLATTGLNGALHVIPGSHRWVPTYRGPTIPGLYDALRPQLRACMEPVLVAAGEAIVFDPSLLHSSPENRSDRPRVVVNVFATTADACLRTAWFDPASHRGAVELFEQEPDFLERFEQFGHDVHARPRVGRSLGLFPYDFPRLDAGQLAAFRAPAAQDAAKVGG